MAETNALIGYGSLLKIGDGEVSETFTTIAEVTNISGPSLSMDTPEATHMESPDYHREVIAGLLDGGEVTFDINFLPGTDGHQDLLSDNMQTRTKRNFELVYDEVASDPKWEFSGYITDFSTDAPVDDVLTASLTIKITGKPVLSTPA